MLKNRQLLIERSFFKPSQKISSHRFHPRVCIGKYNGVSQWTFKANFLLALRSCVERRGRRKRRKDHQEQIVDHCNWRKEERKKGVNPSSPFPALLLLFPLFLLPKLSLRRGRGRWKKKKRERNEGEKAEASIVLRREEG